MNGLDFKPEVLSKEYVKEHGVPYDDDVFYQDDYHIGALYDGLPELGGKPFTGLLYELYNDKLIYYQFFTDGYGNGEFVRFYETGNVASYSIMKKDSFLSISYCWYKNGKLKSFSEVDKKRNYINSIKYDEDGNITLLIRNGVTIVKPT
jgi:antitoxin component YwqK of YwqJK toxin-antitoxin module